MLRTFHEHDIRYVDSLDGRWEFTTEADRRDRARLPKKYARTMHVPSAWEMRPGLENYRGKGWLRTMVPAVEGYALRLIFGGVSHTGTVYIDGELRGTHYDAFTPWDVVVDGLTPGTHELVVEVDNSFGDHSALHVENDYMTYGGITRPVELQFVPPVYIKHLHATPVRRGRSWSLEVRVQLHNWGRKTLERRMQVEVAGKTLDLGRIQIKGGHTAILTGVAKNLDVIPWTPAHPSLYFVEACLLAGEEPEDDLVDRIGFREVRVRGKHILLNGSPVRLRGYNRHEDHPQFGNALPLEAMVTDLEIMRDLGSNTVRTSHYPNDMRFLDLCDEMGFLVWEESHARSVNFDHPKYRKQITDSTTEMVNWHFNHPSIVIWGCLNECDSVSASGRREHARILRLLKKLDPSRPVTFASNRRDADVCLGLVDIVSWNIYTAWYEGGVEDVEPAIKRLLKWLHSPKSRGGRGKPVILSEFGAGAVYGCRHPRQQHWSEEYQDKVLDACLSVYLDHPDIAGSLIWQFCDCRVTSKGWKNRPRNMNNKGTVDEYRRPKLAYQTVKARLTEAAKKWDNP